MVRPAAVAAAYAPVVGAAAVLLGRYGLPALIAEAAVVAPSPEVVAVRLARFVDADAAE